MSLIIFNYVTGYALAAQLERLAVSPLTLRKRIRDHIEREIDTLKQVGQQRFG